MKKTRGTAARRPLEVGQERHSGELDRISECCKAQCLTFVVIVGGACNTLRLSVFCNGSSGGLLVSLAELYTRRSPRISGE